MKDKDLFILQSQYNGCWWPGDEGDQGISNNGINQVIPEYSALSAQEIFTHIPT